MFNLLNRLVLFNSLLSIAFIFVQNEIKKDIFSAQTDKLSWTFLEIFTGFLFFCQILDFFFLLK